jgi:predicted Zn-dependent peptidase
MVDKSTTAYQVNTSDPMQPLPNMTLHETTDVPREYNVTNLTNGFTVLTESQAFPGTVNMGFMMDVGTRDETAETSGACLALKNTYLKTLKHTNETVNYGMIQMSGGSMTMDYDEETTYFKGSCIEYDVIDMFQMMVDISLEPRSVLAANVARSKNKKSHDLFNHLAKFDPFAQQQDLLKRTAYGYNTLGMPRLGLANNIDNIDSRMMQQFMMDNITPRKCLIVASGIKNHKEYVDLVKERLGDMLPVPEQNYQRASSTYIGGEYRSWSETPATNISLVFEAAPTSSQDQATQFVMQHLLGSATGYSAGGPGKGMHCRTMNLLGKHSYIDGASTINTAFSDSGLFGMSIEGAGSHSQDLMGRLVDELNELKNPIDEVELNRAKNCAKMSILQAMERSDSRLEEIARNFMTFGDLTFHQYCEKIDAVSSMEINSVATKVMSGKPTMLVTGGAINLVPAVTDVARQLT